MGVEVGEDVNVGEGVGIGEAVGESVGEGEADSTRPQVTVNMKSAAGATGETVSHAVRFCVPVVTT